MDDSENGNFRVFRSRLNRQLKGINTPGIGPKFRIRGGGGGHFLREFKGEAV
jgi:hypothetical protein